MAAEAIADKKKGKHSPKRVVSKVGRFFKDLKGELKKIVWPTKKQVVNNTLVVIAMIFVMGIFIWLMDLGLGKLVNLFLQGA